MKWHVEIVARDYHGQFIQHYFVDGQNQQEAARNARLRFSEDYPEGSGTEYLRCQLVEPDTGVLVL